MTYKFEYTDDTSRQNIINAHMDKNLIEDQHYVVGNFLIFSDVKLMEDQMNEVKNNTDLIILKQEGIV